MIQECYAADNRGAAFTLGLNWHVDWHLTVCTDPGMGCTSRSLAKQVDKLNRAQIGRSRCKKWHLSLPKRYYHFLSNFYDAICNVVAYRLPFARHREWFLDRIRIFNTNFVSIIDVVGKRDFVIQPSALHGEIHDKTR